MRSKIAGVNVLLLLLIIVSVARHAGADGGKDARSSTKSEPGMETYADAKPSCEQCKYIPCLRSSIKLLEAYIKEFHDMAERNDWGNIEKPGDDYLDLKSLITPEARRAAMAELDEQRTAMWKAFPSRIDRKLVDDRRKHCAIAATGELMAKTDPLLCSIEQQSMKDVANAIPCREIYKAALMHEKVHEAKCTDRMLDTSSKKGPFIVTPRGEIHEDLEAYDLEITVLKDVLDKVLKSKKATEGCWRCGRTQEVFSGKVECNVNCPKVGLGGSLVFKCFKINTKDGDHVNRLGDQF
jgi:hypothetical protein